MNTRFKKFQSYGAMTCGCPDLKPSRPKSAFFSLPSIHFHSLPIQPP